MPKARRLRSRRYLLLMSLIVVVLGACSGPDAPGTEKADAPAASDSVGPALADTDVMTLPRIAGLPARRARHTLRDMGFTVRLVSVRGSACVRRGEVLEQRPAWGSDVAADARVTLVVNRPPRAKCGLGLWETSDLLRRSGGKFAAFARGDLAGLPADTPITLFLGGVRRGVTQEPTDRSSWRLCPPANSYAGRVCPFSAVEVISDWPGPLAITSDPPTHTCAHPATFEARSVGGVATVTLTPDEELDCSSYWAVQLAVNDMGQVVASNLVLAEP